MHKVASMEKSPRMNGTAVLVLLATGLSLSTLSVACTRRQSESVARAGTPVNTVPKTSGGSPSGPRLAAPAGGFDDIGRLLGDLGPGYRYELIQEGTVPTAVAASRFDV